MRDKWDNFCNKKSSDGSKTSRLHTVVLNRQQASLHHNSFFVCLAAICSRDGCVLSQFFVTKNLFSSFLKNYTLSSTPYFLFPKTYCLNFVNGYKIIFFFYLSFFFRLQIFFLRLLLQ
jgi:hypothetical protein